MQGNEEKRKSIDIQILMRFMEGNASDEETNVVKQWFSDTGSEQELFEKCLQFWDDISPEQDAKGYNGTRILSRIHDKIRIEELVSITGPNIWRTIMRYAAIFMIAFTLGGLLFYHFGLKKFTNPGPSFSELIVPMGSHAQFILPDRTAVTLNAGSRLKYDNRFGIINRTVQLEGEGYFIVEKDAARPFIVKTSHLDIKALGTEFNVKAYPEDKTIETTLVKGSVEIQRITDKSKAEETVLKPNQKLTFYKEDSKLVDQTITPNEKIEKNNQHQSKTQKANAISRLVPEDVNVKPLISWKENRWIFDKQSLSQIAVDLERRFDVQIIIETEQLKSFRFTGIILAEPIEQVLEVISLSAPINFQLKGRVVTLSKSKRFEEINKSLYNQ